MDREFWRGVCQQSLVVLVATAGSSIWALTKDASWLGLAFFGFIGLAVGIILVAWWRWHRRFPRKRALILTLVMWVPGLLGLTAAVGYATLKYVDRDLLFPPPMVVHLDACEEFRLNQIHRICLENRSSGTIEHVEARIISINPKPSNLETQNLILHFTDEGALCRLEPRSLWRGSPPLHVDVVGYGGGLIKLYHCATGQDEYIAGGNYVLTLAISGGGTTGTILEKLWVDVVDDQLTMRRLLPNDPPPRGPRVPFDAVKHQCFLDDRQSSGRQAVSRVGPA